MSKISFVSALVMFLLGFLFPPLSITILISEVTDYKFRMRV